MSRFPFEHLKQLSSSPLDAAMDKRRDSFAYESRPSGIGNRPGRKMGMPKPIRLLAGATMALFFFLVFQIVKSPGVIKAQGGREKVDDMVRDPNLDRM